MHETQFVKALAATREEAIEQFAAHVRAFGGVDSWWTLTGALDPVTGAIHVPPPSIPEWTDPAHVGELHAQHAEEARVLREEYGTIEVWLQAAWEAAASSWEVGDLPWLPLGDPTPAQVQAIARFRSVPLEELPRWFLREAHDQIQRRYRDLPLDGSAGALGASRRLGVVHAFEAVFAAVRDEVAAAHLPFLRGQGVYDWPSHLVGEGGGGVSVQYLMIDMHR